jgi:uncharacterized membrane protein
MHVKEVWKKETQNFLTKFQIKDRLILESLVFLLVFEYRIRGRKRVFAGLPREKRTNRCQEILKDAAETI